jgi:prevent-host-death family protein
MATVPAADANRRFSSLLREARSGRTVIITSHGRAVAKLVPADARAGLAATARAGLLARLRSQPVTSIGRWTRDELYGDER